MSDPSASPNLAKPVPSSRAAETERQLAQIAALLKELEGNVNPAVPQAELTRDQENELVEVRLGIASALYTALDAKHPPTARHCLRTALGCSSWATLIGLESAARDDLELAALLHDVGKIGVADAVLLKPGALSAHEATAIEAHWEHGRAILRSCGCSHAVLDIVRYTRTWFDASRGVTDRAGEQIPLGSRMLSIVDAFDAMMTDHVYRPALSLERAFHELLRNAGSQFDPSLVVLFIKLFEDGQLDPSNNVARRWLQDLNPEVVQGSWKRAENPQRGFRETADALFHNKLLDNMHDGVVFIDQGSRITLWNRGAERMTGIPANSMVHQLLLPSVIRLRDDKGKLIKDDECPIAQVNQSGMQFFKRMSIRSRGGNDVPVDVHAMPVCGVDGNTLGVTLLLHDASSEMSLEQRCQNLHEIATRDPLTQIANRAEFDRVLGLFVAAHQESKRPCSMLICDIDRFKRINDTFGHQAGDAIIQSFAKVLQNAAQPGDLVARYGGEEFVMLCADCDNTTIARRAEELRLAFAELRQPSLNSQCAAASFGVTEIQPGDTPETMLRRADRALLLAKETGRNKVVQLGIGGTGHDEGGHEPTRVKQRGNILLAQEMITQSPIDRTIDKLRGFIADHHGELVAISRHNLSVKLGQPAGIFFRRTDDRNIPVILDMTFEEETSGGIENKPNLQRTRICIEVRPQQNRDRRQADAVAKARQLLISLRAYLMAVDVTPRQEVESLPDTPFQAEGVGGWFGSLFRKAPAAPTDDR